MRRATFLAWLVSLSMVGVCLGQNPLPDEIFTAKRVFLRGGTQEVLDRAAWEINNFDRFTVVATQQTADVVFEFVLHWRPGQRFAIESLDITDAKTGETLYGGDREGLFASWSRLAVSLLQDLRDRIEFEYAIQLGKRAARYFNDLSLYFVTLAGMPSDTSRFKDLDAKATSWKALADEITNDCSQTEKFYADSTKHDPHHNSSKAWRHNAHEADKLRVYILSRTCPTLDAVGKIPEQANALRPNLPPTVIRALDGLETDLSGLDEDCRQTSKPMP
jgi:hypothetical protein